MTREHGWECPKCARIWAPRIAACGACNTEIDYSQLKAGSPITVAGDFVAPIAPVWPYNILPEWSAWSYTSDDQSFVD